MSQNGYFMDVPDSSLGVNQDIEKVQQIQEYEQVDVINLESDYTDNP